jgi:ribonuclease P protein component
MGKIGRLTSPADFRRTYSEGKRASVGAVVAHVRPTDEPGPARIGVTAMRGLGGSVSRNRAKRRVREAVRVVRDEVRPGSDVVLVASAAATRVDFQDMVDSVRRALAQAGGCR